METRNWNSIAVALAFALVLAAPAHASTNNTSVANNPDRANTPRTLDASSVLDINDGGAITPGMRDALVEKHGICRWLDNNSAQTVFVPYRTQYEWEAFIDAAPAGVVRSACCAARTVQLVSSDGQIAQFTLDTGREGASDTRGSTRFEMTFPIEGGTETVSEEYVCEGGEWTGRGETRSSTVEPAPEASAPTSGGWTVGAFGACSTTCGLGVQTREVTCAYDSCTGAMPATTRPCGDDKFVSSGSFCYQREGGGDRLTCSNRCARSGKTCDQAGLNHASSSDAVCQSIMKAFLPSYKFGGNGLVGTHVVMGCFAYHPADKIYRTGTGDIVRIGKYGGKSRPQTCGDWLIGTYAYPCPCK